MNRTMPKAAALAVSALALPVILGASGCETNNNVPPGAMQDPVLAQQYPYIVIERPLQKFAVVDYTAILVDRADGEHPMSVEVPLRSTAYQQMAIQHRFQWFDESGRLLDNEGWVFGTLEPGTQVILKSNATSLDAAQYRLEVRSAR